ncbi:MAG TPA: sigma-70 family RNA polymerase sigma factor [Candidatus Acidoferrales bacterium]|jgi:RNA polymerase sigma factor (sigma-70 family)
MATLSEMKEEKRVASSDVRLVRDCLRGREEAWSALIHKYKNLIFSIPIKYGLSRDDAADVFQGVCLGLLSELPKLREPRALPKWLMQVTAHKCLHWRRQQLRLVSSDSEDAGIPEIEVPAAADRLLLEAEQEQIVREALTGLAPRCRRLVQMLFFEEPVRSYQDIAATLGVAVGSIGFIRQRCLDRLRRRLDEMGFGEIEA